MVSTVAGDERVLRYGGRKRKETAIQINEGQSVDELMGMGLYPSYGEHSSWR